MAVPIHKGPCLLRVLRNHLANVLRRLSHISNGGGKIANCGSG